MLCICCEAALLLPSTRDALQRALELLVENPGDVSVNFPKKHTVYPYLARTAEAKGPKTGRMLRLRPGWDSVK